MSMRDVIEKAAEIFIQALGHGADAFGEAIADIRHKLIDEGWFGRRAMPDISHAHPISETLGWTTHAEREARGWQEPARQHEPERDQDQIAGR